MGVYKKWCIFTFSLLLFMLVFIVSVTVVVDPFFQYHKPFDGITYTLNDQTYQNPGIVRHFEYDSLITGTSMTENFQASYFREVLGDDAIKVPYAGAKSKNMNIILEKALASNPNLKTVYLGLDLYMLEEEDVNATRNPLPEYLYNSNPFDDVNYLFNKDVIFKRTYPSIINSMNGTTSTSFDDYSFWASDNTFSQYTVMSPIWNVERVTHSEQLLEEAIIIADMNLQENILPVVKAYPDVKFVIFYPPYSILFWYQNYAERELAVLEHSIKSLLPFGNVELYFFQNDNDIVTNLYNYKDYSHYSADVNSYIVDCFKEGTHKLTVDNYVAELQIMRGLVEEFDFGILFGESNSFLRENNWLNYMDMLYDSRYITFIVSRLDVETSARDIFGNNFDEFGLNESRMGKGYIAIVNGGSTIYQSASDHSIRFNDKVFDLDVEILSEQVDAQNYVEIRINGIKYTTNQAGVNIVVFDLERQRVLDNIAIDIDSGKLSRN